MPDAMEEICFMFLFVLCYRMNGLQIHIKKCSENSQGTINLKKCLYALWCLASLNEVSQHNKSNAVSTRK